MISSGAIISLALTALSLIAGAWRFFTVRTERKRAQAEEREKAKDGILSDIDRVNKERDLLEHDPDYRRRLRERFFRD